MIRFDFVNDRTGPDEAANYRVEVSVNNHVIATASVKGHPRAEHWTALLRRCAQQNAVSDSASHGRASEAPMLRLWLALGTAPTDWRALLERVVEELEAAPSPPVADRMTNDDDQARVDGK